MLDKNRKKERKRASRGSRPGTDRHRHRQRSKRMTWGDNPEREKVVRVPVLDCGTARRSFPFCRIGCCVGNFNAARSWVVVIPRTHHRLCRSTSKCPWDLAPLDGWMDGGLLSATVASAGLRLRISPSRACVLHSRMRLVSARLHASAANRSQQEGNLIFP